VPMKSTDGPQPPPMGRAAERCKMRGVRDFASPRQPNRAEREDRHSLKVSLFPSGLAHRAAVIQETWHTVRFSAAGF